MSSEIKTYMSIPSKDLSNSSQGASASIPRFRNDCMRQWQESLENVHSPNPKSFDQRIHKPTMPTHPSRRVYAEIAALSKEN